MMMKIKNTIDEDDEQDGEDLRNYFIVLKCLLLN